MIQELFKIVLRPGKPFLIHPFYSADMRRVYRIKKDPGKMAYSAGIQQRSGLIDNLIGCYKKLFRALCFF